MAQGLDSLAAGASVLRKKWKEDIEKQLLNN